MAFIERKIVLSLFLFAEIFVSAQLEVGDPCGPKKDRICTLAKFCDEAVKAIKARKPHGLEKCGWQDKDEIVCCTKPGSAVERFPVRKSTEECMKYWNVSQVDYTPFIINGYNATLGEFPHMAALGYEKDSEETYSWDCGGSLISKNFVLTAAHCIVRSDGKKPLIVRLGKLDLFGDEDGVEPQDIKVAESIANDQYKHFDKLNDIALLRLERDVDLSKNVKPICLYIEDNIPNNAGLIIAGWGRTNRTGTSSRFLLKAYVKSVDLGSCNQTYLESPFKKPLLDKQLCALSPEEYPSDTCQGDSGGPLQILNRKDNKESPLIIVGITSFGRGCGGSTPSVYTRISGYLDWIESTVWP